MDRAIYSDGVEVHQAHLQYGEDSSAFHILRRWTDGGTMGVVSGLEVTVSAIDATRIDIAAGSGYAPNGELVEVLATIPAVALANYGVGVDNYVCLVYTEVETHPEAVVTGGRTAMTRTERAYRVRVLTLTELNALVATSADMLVDARDRTLVVGIVNANGAAVVLTSGDLTIPPAIPRLVSIAQPASITGVEFTYVAPLTPTTNERLALGDAVTHRARVELQTLLTPPGTAQLRYRAPGDSAFGSAVVVGAGGAFTLASSTATLTATVTVVQALLDPLVSATVTEDLDVFEMYQEVVRRGGARDEPHRRSAGGTLPQLTNPHGQTLSNLTRSASVQHGLVLGTDLVATQAKALVPRIVTAQAPVATSVRTFLWEIPLDSASGRKIRLYVNNFRTLEVTVNARWNGAQWIKDAAAETATKFSVFDSGFASFARTAASGAAWDDTAWTSTPIFNSGLAGTTLQGEVSFNGAVRLGGGLLGTLAGRDIPRVYTEYDSPNGGGQQRTLHFEQRQAGGTDDERVLRIYHTNSGTLSTDAVELTLNASWDTTNNSWFKGEDTASALKIEIARGTIRFLQRLAGSGQFVLGGGDIVNPDAWDAPIFSFDAATGDLSAGGDFIATSSGSEYTYSSAHTGRRGIMPSTGVIQPGSVGPFINTPLLQKATAIGDFLVHWPLDVPDGATILRVQVAGDFTVVAGALHMELRRFSNGGADVSLHSGGVTSLSGAAVVADIPADQNNIVDLENYNYYLRFLPAGATNNGFTLRAFMQEWEHTRLRP